MQAMIIEHVLIYVMTGAIAGLIAGTLGIGGGMIIVPALLYIFQLTNNVPHALEMHFAAGTSLAIMIFTGQSSVRAHMRKKVILWSAYRRLQLGIILGAVVGVLMAHQLPTHWLKVLLAVVLFLIAAEMMFNTNLPCRKDFPPQWVNRLVGMLIGFKSGLLGIGGGALVIPYLSYCGIERRQTAGVSAMCTLTVALIGTIAVIITSSTESDLPAWATGYVYWPAVLWVAIPSMIFAQIGAHLTYKLPVNHLRHAFIVVLLIAAIDLIV